MLYEMQYKEVTRRAGGIGAPTIVIVFMSEAHKYNINDYPFNLHFNQHLNECMRNTMKTVIKSCFKAIS